ncbi:NUDIX domain-containing protein [Gabonibacter sp. KD22]|nr:NUDIX domain-containing protein [Gabonibacter chumensis]MCR9012060.1 NUDIX domain-containing protein [Gabonibacter chumensis]
MASYKSLLPSFLLIVAYFIADEFFGPKIGLLAAIVWGGGEFLYVLFKEKRIDKTILWNTVLFIVLGILSVVSEGSSLEKLQPAIIEAALTLLLGIFAFSKADITQTMPASYRRSVQITPEQQNVMRRTIKFLFYLVGAHTIIVFIAALFATESTYAFISGPLLYLLIGLFFLTIIVKNKILARAARYDEWLPLVNEKGEVIGKATRRSCHSGSKLLHPVVHLHLINEKGDIFLQKRSMQKKLLPGMWDSAVGGHVAFGERIEEALKRETQEELGIEEFKARFLGSYIWESSRERELVFSFISTSHAPANIHNDEVDEGRYWTRQEIEQNLNREIFTPNFIHEYSQMLKKRSV